MADIASALKVGTYLDGRYRIQNILGSGGFGITYGAINLTNNQRCAIKEFFPRQIAVRMNDGMTVSPVDQETVKTYEHGIERFLEEADALQTLHNVERVVEVYDFFQQNGTCYFVMEYLDGMTLRKLAKMNGGTISWDNLKFLIESTGNALSQVHAKGIFHRDISPDNIFICSNFNIKLIDFGAAKNDTQNDARTVSVVLKKGYAPIEQYSAKSIVSPKVDIYAFGATMYYLLTRTMPVPSVDRVINDDLVEPKKLNPNISDEWNKVILKCMQIKAEDRYNSAEETFEHLLTNMTVRTRYKDLIAA